jgi:hypothetical protein
MIKPDAIDRRSAPCDLLGAVVVAAGATRILYNMLNVSKLIKATWLCKYSTLAGQFIQHLSFFCTLPSARMAPHLQFTT